MDINKFAKRVAFHETGDRQVDIAQIKQILNVINKLTKGVFYAVIKLMTVLLLVCVSAKAAVDFTSVELTLIDHVAPTTQFRSGETRVGLMDSIVLIGSHEGKSLADLQFGFNGLTKPESGKAQAASFLVGGYLKLSSIVNPKLKFPPHWAFLRSLEWGPSIQYDFRDKVWRGNIVQASLAFGLEPK